ncbi:hypothetical protein [Halorussus halobius]|uniref:hypothetical protein n=1 Tax=Halorussus halobius TaxID=1710537 RepID=UPI001092579D|nr:hypothetical protein [Halorussus halobius]
MTRSLAALRRGLSISVVLAGVAVFVWGLLWIRSPTNAPTTLRPVDAALGTASEYVWLPALGAFGVVVGSVPALRTWTRRSRAVRAGTAAGGLALVGVGGLLASLARYSLAGAVYVSPSLAAGAAAIWTCRSAPPPTEE